MTKRVHDRLFKTWIFTSGHYSLIFLHIHFFEFLFLLSNRFSSIPPFLNTSSYSDLLRPPIVGLLQQRSTRREGGTIDLYDFNPVPVCWLALAHSFFLLSMPPVLVPNWQQQQLLRHRFCTGQQANILVVMHMLDIRAHS